MPLQRGEVQGYDFNRMIVEFTMHPLPGMSALDRLRREQPLKPRLLWSSEF
jgi:hypothetical protein